MAENKVATEPFEEATTPLLVEGEAFEEEPNNKVEPTVAAGPTVAAIPDDNIASKDAPDDIASKDAPKGTVTGPPTGDVPPGVEPGGVWGTYRYLGGTSGAVACLGCLCLGIPALLVLFCPLDQRDAYKVNGRIYDPEGEYLGTNTRHFIASMNGSLK